MMSELLGRDEGRGEKSERRGCLNDQEENGGARGQGLNVEKEEKESDESFN